MTDSVPTTYIVWWIIMVLMALLLCYRCWESARGDNDALAQHRQEQLIDVRDTFVEQGEPEWECAVCGFHNLPRRTTCTLCTTKRHDVLDVSRASQLRDMSGVFFDAPIMRSNSNSSYSTGSSRALSRTGLRGRELSGWGAGLRDGSLSHAMHGITTPPIGVGAAIAGHSATVTPRTEAAAIAAAAAAEAVEEQSASSGGAGLSASARERSFRVRRLNALNMRQKAAARRRQWVRRKGEDGLVRWQRAGAPAAAARGGGAVSMASKAPNGVVSAMPAVNPIHGTSGAVAPPRSQSMASIPTSSDARGQEQELERGRGSSRAQRRWLGIGRRGNSTNGGPGPASTPSASSALAADEDRASVTAPYSAFGDGCSDSASARSTGPNARPSLVYTPPSSGAPPRSGQPSSPPEPAPAPVRAAQPQPRAHSIAVPTRMHRNPASFSFDRSFGAGARVTSAVDVDRLATEMRLTFVCVDDGESNAAENAESEAAAAAAAAAAMSPVPAPNSNMSRRDTLQAQLPEAAVQSADSMRYQDYDLEAVAALPYMEKWRWLHERLADMQLPWNEGHVCVSVRRSLILEDSTNQLLSNRLAAKDLHRPFRVEFRGEPGIDAGGLEREWFEIVCRGMLSSEEGLFESTHAAEDMSYVIRRNATLLEAGREALEAESQLNDALERIKSAAEHVRSGKQQGMAEAESVRAAANEERAAAQASIAAADEKCKLRLRRFRFFGRFLGKAIVQKQQVPARFCLPYFKHMLGVPVTFSDLAFVDGALHRSLEYLLNNDGAENLCLTFSMTVPREAQDGDTDSDASGTAIGSDALELELVEGGSEREVTDENKREYVALVIRWTLLSSVQAELAALMAGLYEVVPRQLLSVFDYQELELLLCGLAHIDVEDWRVHTVYEGTFASLGDRSPVVAWFWGIVSGFSEEEKARLLQFATGTSRPPAQGFKALQSNDGYVRRFAINGTALPAAKDREAHPEALWPRAHTCFNKIDLPEFETREELERMLTLSINMEIGGFTME